MNIKLKTGYINPKTYYQFTLVNVEFRDTWQFKTIYIILFNVFLKLVYDKKDFMYK